MLSDLFLLNETKMETLSQSVDLMETQLGVMDIMKSSSGSLVNVVIQDQSYSFKVVILSSFLLIERFNFCMNASHLHF